MTALSDRPSVLLSNTRRESFHRVRRQRSPRPGSHGRRMCLKYPGHTNPTASAATSDRCGFYFSCFSSVAAYFCRDRRVYQSGTLRCEGTYRRGRRRLTRGCFGGALSRTSCSWGRCRAKAASLSGKASGCRTAKSCGRSRHSSPHRRSGSTAMRWCSYSWTTCPCCRAEEGHASH